MKSGAIGILATMLLGLMGVAWAQLEDRIGGNSARIKSLDEKIDDLHWYLIRSKNVEVRKTK